MAGDWIKMRASLATDPKVVTIGQQIAGSDAFASWASAFGSQVPATLSDNALRYVVTGALHNAWCAANEHGDGDVVRGADFAWLDGIVGIHGFAKAMESVGWLEQTEDGLRFPKFNRHNTSGAERQKRYRDRKRNARNVTGDITCDAHSNGREEKRREDINTPIAPKGANGRFAPPTLEEVKSYCTERENSIDPEEFIDFYSVRGWKPVNCKTQMKDWKAAIRTWEKRAKERSAQRLLPTDEEEPEYVN